MTLVDLIKDLIDTSKERFKTPISGAFIWSFLIYNWRPVTVLLFSKISVEDRIYIIDQEYCKPEAILWPIGFAIFYTVILPFIMWAIDWPVVYGKKIRLSKVYEAKKNELAEKIKIAATVFDLKDAESGNKEKQELLDKITELTNINAATVDSHKNIVSQLTSNLEESSKIIQELRTNNETYKTAMQKVVREESDKVEFFKTGNKNRFDELDSLSSKFNNRELQYLKSLNINDGLLNIENIPENVLIKFYEVGILKKENSNIKLTVLGKMLLQYIKIIK